MTREASAQLGNYLKQYREADQRVKDAITAKKSLESICGLIREKRSIDRKMSELRMRSHYHAAAICGTLTTRKTK